MFGTPVNGDAFEIATLTFEDVKEYMNRIGKTSPTPMDAMRFAALSMKISKIFSSEEDQNFIKECQRTKQISRSATNAILIRMQPGYTPKPKPG